MGSALAIVAPGVTEVGGDTTLAFGRACVVVPPQPARLNVKSTVMAVAVALTATVREITRKILPAAPVETAARIGYPGREERAPPPTASMPVPLKTPDRPPSGNQATSCALRTA